MKTVSKGTVALDASKMSDSDLMEGAYMLEACATLLRQAFGIVSLSNELQAEKMTEKELKSFAQQFDLIHKTCRVFAKGICVFVSNRSKDV